MSIGGTAPNQTYTRTDGVRTGAAVCAQAQAAGVNNTAALADVRENDFATAINTCVFKSGGNTPTANLPMGGYKHTGAGAASASGQYVEYAQWLALTASATQAGIVELATDAEVQTGTDTARAITPAGLQAVTATETRKGVIELATDAEVIAGTDTTRAITPAGFAAGYAASLDADTLKADVSDNLTAGFTTTAYSSGTKSSGTFTPDPANGNIQTATNGGAHTLAPPSSTCTMIIQYTNNASAGTITTSGFTIVDGDAKTTTNGDDFLFYITKVGSFSRLTVAALQ